MKTERGHFPTDGRVRELSILRSYLWGQKWMAAQVKMWQEGKREGTFFPSDMDEEPENVRRFFLQTIFPARN